MANRKKSKEINCQKKQKLLLLSLGKVNAQETASELIYNSQSN